MKCEPQELFDAAMIIATAAKAEGMYRATVNRSYYASYHACVQYHAELDHIGDLNGATGVHEQLINRLANPNKKLSDNRRNRSIALGKYLRMLVTLRVHADYDLLTPLGNKKMEEAVQIATTIFTAIKGDPSKKQ